MAAFLASKVDQGIERAFALSRSVFAILTMAAAFPVRQGGYRNPE